MSNWYDEVGKRYTNLRIQDRRIARHIHEALRNAETVANIGVGTGSYEPLECEVLAIEPSALMLNQYTGAGKRVQGIAEALPFGDNFVEASMGILTLHHWRNWKKGLKKMLRISQQSAVLLTHKPDLYNFWLFNYFPAIHEIDQKIFSSIQELAAGALAGVGELSLPLIFLTAILAAVPVDLFWYWLGRVKGGKVLNLLCSISLEHDFCVRNTERTFGRLGVFFLLVAKFVPGMATLAPPMAGMTKMNLALFLVLDTLGTLIWVSLLAGIGT